LRGLAPWILLLLLLAGCTGTSSQQAPRLLTVTYGTGADSRVALVRDNGTASGTARLEFLPASVRPLEGRAVALDIVDRAGSRSELVLLLHRGGNGYSLAFMNVEGIDPEAPAAFAPSRTGLDLTAALAGVAADPAALCLTAVQVTGTGSHAALLNGGPGCDAGVTAAPELFIVDLTGGDGPLSIAASAELLPVQPFIRQSTVADENELFFLIGGPGSNAELWSTPLPPDSVFPQGVAAGTFSGGGSSGYPLDIAAGSEGLAALALRSASLDLLLPDGTSRQVATPATARRFIRDPFDTELEQVLVLRTSGFSVHRDATDSRPFTGNLTAVTDAAVDPERLYVYFLSPGMIRILDILDLPAAATPDQGSGRLASNPVAELLAPAGLISWVPAAVPPPGLP
jgi:hypothetical protein